MASAYSGQGQGRRVHGTIRDSYDPDDIVKVHSHHEIHHAVTTTHVDLRDNVCRVYEQGQIGSCTANALCSAYSFHRFKYQGSNMNPSRLFLYYNSRNIEHSIDSDDGLRKIKDSMKAFDESGVCRESKWPYTRNRLYKEPVTECYVAAEKNEGCTYERLLKHHTKRRGKQDDIHQLKACLHQESPFVFGFDVHENFYNLLKHSIMPHPSGKLEGGHAVLAVGYDDNYHGRGCVIVLNSWGRDFGDNGYFYMPYEIILSPKYCYDFWKVTFPNP